MNDYEAKLEARRERLQDAAERRRAAGQAKIESGMGRLRSIPFGQPILVGHHSEKRDRNFRRKAGNAIDRGMELTKEAAELERRAASVGTAGISSDDPEAPDKLRHRIAELEHKQRAMIAHNRAQTARCNAGEDPNKLPRFAAWELSNNGANIRRLKARLEQLEQLAGRTTKTRQIGDVLVIENVEANRLQLVFPGIPTPELRARLKSAGFRWSPTAGAWQRHLTASAVHAAEYALKGNGNG